FFPGLDPITLAIHLAEAEPRLQAGESYHVRGLLPVPLRAPCAQVDVLQRRRDEYQLIVHEGAAEAVGLAGHGRRAGEVGAAAAVVSRRMRDSANATYSGIPGARWWQTISMSRCSSTVLMVYGRVGLVDDGSTCGTPQALMMSGACPPPAPSV